MISPISGHFMREKTNLEIPFASLILPPFFIQNQGLNANTSLMERDESGASESAIVPRLILRNYKFIQMELFY